jgi:hypothetical protein
MAIRAVTLMIPGLTQPPRGTADYPATPSLDRLFARAQRQEDPAGIYERALAARFTDADPLPWAALSFWGDTGQRPDQPLLRADPLHVQAGTHHHIHFDQARLDLDREESASLVAILNEALQPEQMRLVAATPGRWYLELPAPLSVLTLPLSAGLAMGAPPWSPTGPDAARLKRLLTEIQMLLYEHPVNQARERLGQLPINSLWLWGEGPLPNHWQQPFAAIVGNAPLAQGLARATGLQVLPTWDEGLLDRCPDGGSGTLLWVIEDLLRPALWQDPEAWITALAVLEQQLTPLLTALQRGQLDRLTLLPINGAAYRLARWRSRLPWPRNRPFTQSIGPSPT